MPNVCLSICANDVKNDDYKMFIFIYKMAKKKIIPPPPAPVVYNKNLHHDKIMLLFTKKGNKKYNDVLDIKNRICYYSGQENHQIFDELIMDSRIRKLIVRDYNDYYNIEGEVTKIELLTERICKDEEKGIKAKAPTYKIKYTSVYDIKYDFDLSPPDFNKKMPDDYEINTQYKRHYNLFHYYHLNYVKSPRQSHKALQPGIMLVEKAPPDYNMYLPAASAPDEVSTAA